MKIANFVYFCITHGKLIPTSRKRYQFSVGNTKVYKIHKLCRAMFSSFYNISQPNFAILPILRCSSKFSHFNFFQNSVHNAIGPLLSGPTVYSLRCAVTPLLVLKIVKQRYWCTRHDCLYCLPDFIFVIKIKQVAEHKTYSLLIPTIHRAVVVDISFAVLTLVSCNAKTS